MKKQISNILKIIVIAIIMILFRQAQAEAVTWGGHQVNSDGDLQSLVVSGSFFDGNPLDLVGQVLPDLGTNTINKIGGKCIQNHHYTGNGFNGYKVSTIIDLNNFTNDTIAKPGDFVSYRSGTSVTKYTMASLGSITDEYHNITYNSRTVPTAGHGISTLGYLMYAARNETRNDAPNKLAIEHVFWLDQSEFVNKGIVNKEIDTGTSIWVDQFNNNIAQVRAGDEYANSSAKYSFRVNSNNRSSDGSVRTATFTRPTSENTAYATYNVTNKCTYVGPYSLKYNYSYANNELKIVNATVTKSDFKIKGYTNTRNSTDIKSFTDLKSDESFYIVIDGKLTQDFALQIKVRNPVIKARMIFLVGKNIYTQNMMVFQGETGYTYDALTIPVKGMEEKPLTLKIKKIDSQTREGLDGVQFTITNSSGKYLDANGNVTSKKYVHTTVNDGWIVINNVPEGIYTATEIKSLEGYTITNKKTSINVSQDRTSTGTITVAIENTPDEPEPNVIRIKKIDSTTKEGLDGVQFTIVNEKGEYLNANAQLTSKEYIHTTKGEGWIVLSDVPEGKYTVTETTALEGYIKNTEKLTIEVTKNSANTQTFTIENTLKPEEPEPEQIDIKIHKVDENGNSLSEAVFAIYNQDEQQYIDENGNLVGTTPYPIKTQNSYISITKVPKGKYIATEIQAPEGYKAISGTIEILNNDVTTVENEPEVKYIDLEGTVFLDGRDGKQSIRNNMYDDGEGFNGVKVTLKKNGQVVANVASGYDSNGNSTGTAGHYKFLGSENNLRIDVNHLGEYTIEFEYNGLKYESVELQSQITAGASSKATEKDQEREAFNTRYSTVTADTKIANGQSTNKSNGGDIIRYTSQSYTSKIIYQTNVRDDKGNAYDNEGYADDQYHITSYTTEAGLDLSKPNQEGGYPYDPTKDAIVDINFGIYEREHPDVAITTDLATAETSINGYTQIYPYQKRYDQIGNDSAFTVEVKKSDAYYPTYQRNLYKSDVQYTQATSDGSELAVYLTYKVAIKNQSSTINVTVNDIVDYFSKDVTGGIVAIGTDVNTLSEIPAKTNENRYQVTNTDGIQYSSIEEDSGYSKQYITLNKEIKTGEKYQFYVQYKMSIEAIRKTIEGDIKFNNVFELNTVSARKNNGEIWTAVDMDSAVGNCVPSDRQTMEDDTDFAPGIDITTKSDDVRQITGIVFEDQTSSELKAGEERKGNGQYDEGETGVPNATVQLLDIDRGGQIAYSSTNGTDIKSGNDGNYTITGFIPGNYIIKYTYGNGTEKYTAQQYKSTIYVDQARANTNYANGYHDGISTGNKYWYLDEIDARKSDAVDNYDGEIKTLYDMSQATVNMSRTEIEKKWTDGYNDGLQHILNGTTVDNTIAIDAYTPHMGITVEKTDTQEGAYTIPNVDFGIAERARYKVQIEKTINRIQLVQPDGSILRDFTGFDNKLPENTKAIQSQRGISRGFVQFEIDTELLQTTTLLVEYGFKGTNISEVEYIDEAYYKYGIVPQDKENKMVKLSIANIIDYVDNELQYADSSHMITDGKTNSTNKSNGWSTIELNKDENKKYVSADVLNALYNENGQCAYSTILITNGLDTAMLKTGESTTVSLSLNKTLAPTQDAMRYENVTEVVEVKKTWGRELSMEETTSGAGNGQRLGNFNPVGDPNDETTTTIQVKDPDTSYTETIIINPPTGSDQNSIILYTTIGIASLAILAAGVIIIKKKILK